MPASKGISENTWRFLALIFLCSVIWVMSAFVPSITADKALEVTVLLVGGAFIGGVKPPTGTAGSVGTTAGMLGLLAGSWLA